MKILLYLIPGALFGAGLAISGMTNPAKVVNFLDVAGHWDLSLMFVMVGAIGVFATLNQVIHRRPFPLLGGRLPGRRSGGHLDRSLLLGSAVFGVGWGLGGVCPGPGITNLSTLRPEVGAFVATMLVGMVLAQRTFGLDKPVGDLPTTATEPSPAPAPEPEPSA